LHFTAVLEWEKIQNITSYFEYYGRLRIGEKSKYDVISFILRPS